MQINDNHFTRYVNVSKPFFEWYSIKTWDNQNISTFRYYLFSCGNSCSKIVVKSYKNTALLLLNITHVAVVIVVVRESKFLQKQNIFNLQINSFR